MTAVTTFDMKPIEPNSAYYIHPKSTRSFGGRKVFQHGYAWITPKQLPVAVAILKPKRNNEATFAAEITNIKKLQKLDPGHLFTPKLFMYSSQVCIMELGVCDLFTFLYADPGLEKKLHKPQILTKFAYQILDIGIFFHQSGLVYGDIKLENLLLVEREKQPHRVIAIDFDALQSMENPMAYESKGTPTFDAPEIVNAKMLGQKSIFRSISPEKRDCWGFGIVINQVLAKANLIEEIAYPWIGKEFLLIEKSSSVKQIDSIRLNTIKNTLAQLKVSDPLGLICLDPCQRSTMKQAKDKLGELLRSQLPK